MNCLSNKLHGENRKCLNANITGVAGVVHDKQDGIIINREDRREHLPTLIYQYRGKIMSK